MLAIAIRIKLAVGEPHHEVVILVHDLFSTSTRYINAVRVQKVLWYQGQLCQNGWVPLHNVFLVVVSRQIVQVGLKIATAY